MIRLSYALLYLAEKLYENILMCVKNGLSVKIVVQTNILSYNFKYKEWMVCRLIKG